MKSIKQVNIESRPYYVFNDMINIKNLLNIDKISFKSTDAVIYNIKYITMKILTMQILIVKILFIVFLIM